MNIGIMIAPLPMRQVLRPQHRPEQALYQEDEWEYPVAIHGVVAGAQDEGRVVLEWQELFGKYHVPALQIPHARTYHLWSDDPTLPESQITASTSGLDDLETPVPKVIQNLCHMGLSQQAVAQEHPTDTTQAEAHVVYNDMVVKHRDALQAVRNVIQSKQSWVELMTSSTMDDGPETTLHYYTRLRWSAG